jgi:hypothetical protein
MISLKFILQHLPGDIAVTEKAGEKPLSLSATMSSSWFFNGQSWLLTEP